MANSVWLVTQEYVDSWYETDKIHRICSDYGTAKSIFDGYVADCKDDMESYYNYDTNEYEGYEVEEEEDCWSIWETDNYTGYHCNITVKEYPLE